jgi:hypothetical protein
MIQLPLFADDPKPTPDQRQAQQLVEIKTYLHDWNEAQRHRLKHQAATRSSAMSGNSGQVMRK